MAYSTIKELFTAICDAIRGKDGTTGTIAHQDIPSRISAISGGGTGGIDATFGDATADDIAEGKTAIVKGKEVTGNVPVVGENTNFSPITDSAGIYGDYFRLSYQFDSSKLFKLNGYFQPRFSKSNLGDATAEDVAEGKYFTSAAGLKIPGKAVASEQATPEITVDPNGLITATAGTKSATKQLPTKSAAIFTPGATDKLIVSGQYLTGTQTIKGDTNLVAGNIKSGISIFGVAGSFEGSSSSGGLAVQTGTITGTGEAIDIDTGLSSVEYFAIYRDTFASKGLVEAVYRGDTGYTHYVYCSSYTSYAKTCLLSFGNSIGTVREGTFTWSSTSTSTVLTSDVVYNWIAFGTE